MLAEFYDIDLATELAAMSTSEVDTLEFGVIGRGRTKRAQPG